ncbi:hypothetical protein ACFQ1Q_02830 [Winogradskyella litorisediminis]|uniref:Uncharacterized protein n=1 Tax=Winogradskyella litorisediminis TaxID=1156618 RepID=A0ABW3N5D6_9FLAO
MKKLFIPFVALALVFATSCKMDQTKEAKLPEVDVDIDTEAGQLPAFDVDWADVNVGTRTEMVEIPKVVVVMEETEIEVPYLDVDMPDEYGEKMERTIMIEAEVDEFEHNLEIEKVYASGNNLIVVSRLEKMETSLGDKKVRISDQIKLNAPDLNVKHYVVGVKPNRVFNDAYMYVNNESDFSDKVADYKVIYSK